MRAKLLLAFAAGVAVGAGGAYWLWQRLAGGSPVAANTERAQRLEWPGRPQWAERMELPGVPNLHRVNDALYRGGQPSREGMKQLKSLGIRTVLNLRRFHSDRDEIGDTALGYEHLYVNTIHPEEEEVIRFLQIATDPRRQPVFVHCQHGSDRTGLMCAVYRVAVEGWSNQEAIEEWTRGGFGYHKVFQNLVEFLRGLDATVIRRRAGLTGAPRAASGPLGS